MAQLDHHAGLSHRSQTADVIVVGAGVLGTALAITLARQSRSVLLLERSLRQPDRIVGELLQPGGVDALHALGLASCLDGIDAVDVYGYEVIYHGRPVSIPYPRHPTRPGRVQGRSFHHGRFIQRLRAAAHAEPNVTLVEMEVTEAVQTTYTGHVLGVRGKAADRACCFFAPLTIAADGFNSRFRKLYTRQKPSSQSNFWGIELIDAQLPAPCHGHVVLSDYAPVLLYQIGTHETRALIDVPKGLPEAQASRGGVQTYLRAVVLPRLPDKVQPAFAKALEAGRLKNMPNSFLRPAANRLPGLVMLGDAMNMRHPLTGGGMTVALNDVVLVRSLLCPSRVPDLNDTAAVMKQMEALHWQRKQLASVINILAEALYALFAADDARLRILQRGCFEYFLRGGDCVNGPAGLLAGVTRSPRVLFYHFFAVALLAMRVHLSSQPLWRLPWTLIECILVFVKACAVIFPRIASEMRW